MVWYDTIDSEGLAASSFRVKMEIAWHSEMLVSYNITNPEYCLEFLSLT
jgi:hypothetical protein